MRSVLILGGGSDIGLAVARLFAERGYSIMLAARQAESRLQREQSDISLRHGVEVSLYEFDATDTATHQQFVESLTEMPEIAVCAVGLLGDQQQCQHDNEAAIAVMRSNYEGPASIMAVLADSFARRGSGTLVGIGSVAGERGRASNYVYGSAKSGFAAFLSGLRARLAGQGVHVVTVLPGFVDTKMTAGMDLPPILTAKPQQLARAIFQAVEKKQNIIHVKPIWAVIMLLIRHIPESIFKKLSL